MPGLIHDQCSAVHPVAAASPFLRGLDLEALGLRWCAPVVDCAHPLDDGSAGVLYQSIDQTASGLGGDGARWRRLFGALTADLDSLFEDITQPLMRLPRHPVLTARFGAAAMTPATAVGRLWRDEPTRALWAGVAAHAFWRLDRPMTSAVGLMILAAGHVHGWVVAEGGSQAIADALVADLTAHGGRVETGVRVRSAAELPSTNLLLLDVSPSIAADILSDRLPHRVARAYRRFRHGPGAFKVDFAIEGDVPWRAPAAGEAGTVHLGGDAREVFASELAIHRGDMPERPFVLVGQQYLADPQPLGRQGPPALDLRPCPAGLHRRRYRRHHRSDRALRPRVLRAGSRNGSALDNRDVGLQPELRRRRHPERRIIAPPAAVPPPSRPRPLLHRHTGHLPVLSLHTPRRRRTRPLRHQCRPSGPRFTRNHLIGLNWSIGMDSRSGSGMAAAGGDFGDAGDCNCCQCGCAQGPFAS